MIEQTTRRALGVGNASIEAPSFESESNKSASIEAPENEDEDAEKPAGGSETAGTADGSNEDDIEDAEIVPEHLATLKDALEAAECARVREAIIKKATAIRNKALHAPKP
ncbi:hypothetical protein [Streptomyces sp. NPDC058291]|uniref:hypothetical protein n=1 Tax=Streptomyces sp. NPDC058291 TaxID=3346427 RepID=UPI0036E0F05F